jgi:hypothetical protein
MHYSRYITQYVLLNITQCFDGFFLRWTKVIYASGNQNTWIFFFFHPKMIELCPRPRHTGPAPFEVEPNEKGLRASNVRRVA